MPTPTKHWSSDQISPEVKIHFKVVHTFVIFPTIPLKLQLWKIRHKFTFFLRANVLNLSDVAGAQEMWELLRFKNYVVMVFWNVFQKTHLVMCSGLTSFVQTRFKFCFRWQTIKSELEFIPKWIESIFWTGLQDWSGKSINQNCQSCWVMYSFR